jgi:hypothetical protein
MDSLEKLVAEILAVIPGNRAAENLALDVWVTGQQRGEAEGVAMGQVVLAGVREYEAHQRGLGKLIPGRAAGGSKL